MSNMEKVIEILKSLGYVDDGSVEGCAFRSGNAVVGYRAVIIPDRVRLKLPGTNHKASIGKRTTCFYQVVEREAKDFVNFSTKDIEGIKNYAKRIVETI